ncbi:MAG: hypothetical protein JEY94_18110 [Melioribacteraceae bacterium]|nr:hypothetical protein [Melioribacteraceae bacterium]
MILSNTIVTSRILEISEMESTFGEIVGFRNFRSNAFGTGLLNTFKYKYRMVAIICFIDE